MQTWAITQPNPINNNPLQQIHHTIPKTDTKKILIKIKTYNIYQTNLHLTKNNLPPKHTNIIPNHQTINTIITINPNNKSNNGSSDGQNAVTGDATVPQFQNNKQIKIT